MAIIPPGYVEAHVRMDFVGDTEPMFTSCGFRVAAPPFTQADADDLIGSMVATFVNATSTDVSFPGGYVLVGNDGDDGRFDVAFTTVLDGDDGSTCLPQNTALLIQKRSGLTGRRNRGRMFLPGVPRNRVADNGVVEASWVAARTADYATWLDGFATANVDQAVILHSEAPATPAVISSFAVAPLVATQRRRLRR